LTNCTCAIIKPHAIRQTGKIIDWILQSGFEISSLQMYHLDRPTVIEFLDVYKGVLPEFVPLVDHMTSGFCVAIEVRQENAVLSFRDLCGPVDPEIARHLRPDTIRARFGVDRV
jgi:nucleoside-diphosphate kinase